MHVSRAERIGSRWGRGFPQGGSLRAPERVETSPWADRAEAEVNASLGPEACCTGSPFLATEVSPWRMERAPCPGLFRQDIKEGSGGSGGAHSITSPGPRLKGLGPETRCPRLAHGKLELFIMPGHRDSGAREWLSGTGWGQRVLTRP